MSDNQNGVPVTYVTDPPVAAGTTVVSGGSIAIAGQPIQVFVVGGTVSAEFNFVGTVKTDIGQVKIEGAEGNLATVRDANEAKDGTFHCLVVQSIDRDGTPLSEATQLAIRTNGSNANDTLANIDLNTMAATTYLAEIANTQGTQSTALLSTIANQQGTQATSALQVAGGIVLDRMAGTIATSANQVTGNALATVIMNNEGTLATSALQTAQSTLLISIDGHLGTIATSAGQTAQNALLVSIDGHQGTQATSANQTDELAKLAAILTAQGTQSTAGLAQNNVLVSVDGHLGTLAANASLVALNSQLASVISVVGPAGTDAANHFHVEMALNPQSPSTDSFGRLRVSNPDFRFDGQLCYQISPDLWDTAFKAGGTVSYDRTNRLAQLTSTANGTAVMQSHYCSPYTPGRSQLALMTFQMGTTPGYLATRRVGYWDGSNGVYLEQASDGIRLVLASTTGNGNQTIPQASWNIDKLDGTGRSGFTLDLSKVQILAVSFQALYAGRVVVGFDIDGVLCLVHQFLHANDISVPYFAQASLPVRYEAKSTGSNVVSFKAICASVMSEGGGPLASIPSRAFSANNGAATVTVNTRRPLVSVRCKSALNAVANNGVVYPTDADVLTGNQAVFLEIVRNATFTGTAWTSVNADSIAEFDTSATAITGGQTLYSSYVPSASAQEVPFSEASSRLVVAYSSLTGVTDTISVVMTSMAGNTNCAAALNWREIR